MGDHSTKSCDVETDCRPGDKERLVEALDGLDDDASAFAQLVLSHHERGCEADDVALGRLGQQAVVTQAQADVVGRGAHGLVNHNGVEQATAAHCHDAGQVGIGQLLAQDGAEPVGVLCKLLINQDLWKQEVGVVGVRVVSDKYKGCWVAATGMHVFNLLQQTKIV